MSDLTIHECRVLLDLLDVLHSCIDDVIELDNYCDDEQRAVLAKLRAAGRYYDPKT